MDTLVKYDGVKTVRSELGEHVILGQDSFVRDSILGDHVQLNRRNIIEESSIGSYSYTGPNAVIKVADIGRFCCLSWNVSITGNLHDPSHVSCHPFTRLSSFGFVKENQQLDKQRIVIGNDVWIGANACVLPGVTVGDGAVIGAGSVVTRDVPPYAVAAGCPAKVIKYRFDERTISRLIRIRWWDWPEDVIAENIESFEQAADDSVIGKLEKIRGSLNDRSL